MDNNNTLNISRQLYQEGALTNRSHCHSSLQDVRQATYKSHALKGMNECTDSRGSMACIRDFKSTLQIYKLQINHIYKKVQNNCLQDRKVLSLPHKARQEATQDI